MRLVHTFHRGALNGWFIGMNSASSGSNIHLLHVPR